MDGFEVGQVLGFGSYSVVKEARCRESGAFVALKIVKVRNEAEYEQLRAEAGLWRSLRHPNICALSKELEVPGEFVFVMELAGRGDLFSWISKKREDAQVTAKTIFHQLLDAVCYLHTQMDLVHGDIKLENVLLTERPGDGKGFFSVLLADFGHLQAAGKNTLAEPALLGSLEYAAPELIRGEALSKAADIWSLGVVLYALVEGCFPFDADSSRFLKAKIMHEDVKFSDAKAGESGRWQPLIRMLLEKEPQKRPKADCIYEILAAIE